MVPRKRALSDVGACGALGGPGDDHDAVGGGIAAVHTSLQVVGLFGEEGGVLLFAGAEHGPDTLEIL